MKRLILVWSLLCITSVPLLAQMAGPIARSIERAAARATATPSAPVGFGGERRGQSDWTRVARLDADEIVVSLRGCPAATLDGSPSGRRTLVRGSVTDSGLTVLNLNDRTISREAKGALMRAASTHPEYFTVQALSGSVRLNKRVRFEAGAVLVDDRQAVDLAQVIERIERDTVAEISRVHRATGKGAMVGVIAGAGVGLIQVFAACGTHWNTETSTCGNLTGAALIVYPLWGALIGTGIGAATTTTTVVYRAP